MSVTTWHPPAAVLEILELVLADALPPLDDVLALLGATDLGDLAARAAPGAPGAAAPRDAAPGPGGPAGAAPMTGELVIEDAEGTPVARLREGARPEPVAAFTAPPLRAHRRNPADLPDAAARLTAVLPGPPSRDAVTAVLADARRLGLGVRWLVLVGAGRGPLPPEGAWRAARALAEEAARSGVPSDVVPVAAPLLPAPGADRDPLATEVASRYARGGASVVLPVTGLPVSGPAVGGLPVDGDGGGPAEAFARELARAVRPPGRRGVTVFFTGLSGSGKSTLAKALAARLVEDGRRTVTLLDGDEVRRLLSHGLGFSRADRDLNIRRIGFVATEVTRHGGFAICAPIAPFEAVRSQVRAAVEEVGELVLVHVATPLAECERRDRKGLYARARLGEIPDFTGISSPYEPPTDADLVVDTTGRGIDDCLEPLWELISARGHLDVPGWVEQ